MHVFGENWVVIGLMLASAFAMGMLLLTLNLIVAPSKPSRTKQAPYESGMPDVTPVKPRYTPRFYVVAMLFVVFDDLGRYGFLAMLAFIVLLLDGFVYAWKKGALEWV